MGDVRWGVRVTLVGFVAALATLAAASGTACACSCVQLTDAEALRNAQAVFVGTLREVREPTVQLSSDSPSRFLFEVEAVFKGDVHTVQSIVSASDGASCGLELAVGQRALVFAHNPTDYGAEDGEYEAGLCGGTRELGAVGLPEGLGDPGIVLPGSSPVGEDDSFLSIVVRNWYLIAGGVAALVVGVIVIRRRERLDA